MSEMPVPAYGGCLWPVDPACMSEEWNGLDEELQTRAVALASATLRRLTGFRVGGCPITVRPVGVQSQCFVPTHGYPDEFGVLRPGVDEQGQWRNCASNTFGSKSIPLPAPVGEIYEVKVDGATVPPDHYRIFNGNLLTWIGPGDAPWPSTQDVTVPDTNVGTMAVTYLNSYPVDATGAYACGLLAMEYAKACGGLGGKCRLPAGVTSIVRQGVSMEIASGAFPGGMTGLREVDAFVALWNPQGRSQGMTVFWPGQKKHSHQTAGWSEIVMDGGQA